MSEQEIQLIREAMQTLSQTAAPLWGSLVRYVQTEAIAGLVVIAVVLAVAAWGTRKVVILAHENGNPEPIMFTWIGAAILWVFLLFTIFCIPAEVAKVFNPEAAAAMKILNRGQ